MGGTQPQNRGRIAADGNQRVPERAALIAPREPSLGHLRGHAATADAGDAEGTDLLGEEIDNLQIMRESDAALRQRSRDFQRRNDARDSVEPTAVRNGVGVRAKHEDGPGFTSGRATADQIARGVDSRLKPRSAHARLDIGAAFKEERREDAPRPGPAGLRQAGERIDVFRDAGGIDRQIAAHAALPATGMRSGGRTKRPVPGSANTLAPSKASRPRT